jgi:uncharacterized protein YndB with AHSA1/START domain
MTVLAHQLDRVIVIRAPREIVFRFFTDSARWAAWWGEGSTIDPTPGGAVLIRYPGGAEAIGEVVAIDRPERIVFTYGYVGGQPVPPGGSRVTIRLEPHRDGTQLSLSHAFADASTRDQHVQGWRYQLSLFANVVSNELNAGAENAVDAWFRAWAVTDEGERTAALAAVAAADVQFRDRFSAVDGMADLVPHIGAAQQFMPGLTLQRDGIVRQCQGTVLVDWRAVGPDGQPRGSGTNVFVFGSDARITSVVGFWK